MREIGFDDRPRPGTKTFEEFWRDKDGRIFLALMANFYTSNTPHYAKLSDIAEFAGCSAGVIKKHFPALRRMGVEIEDIADGVVFWLEGSWVLRAVAQNWRPLLQKKLAEMDDDDAGE